MSKSPFKDAPETWRRLDFKIMSRGFIKPYTDVLKLENEIKWFKSEGYKIVAFECSLWNNKQAIHDAFCDKFNFPIYYGDNWDALHESLAEIEIQDSGIVVVFNDFDLVDHNYANIIIDIFASRAQRHLIFSQRLLTLIKVNDSSFTLKPYGANNLYWFD